MYSNFYVEVVDLFIYLKGFIRELKNYIQYSNLEVEMSFLVYEV